MGGMARNRNLALLELSWLAWMTCEWAVLVALSVVAYDLGGAVAVGAVGAARLLPGAVLGPAIAALTDRVRRPLVLAASHAVWCIVCVAVALASQVGSMALLVAATAAGSVVSALAKSCVRALQSQVVRSPRELVWANSVYSGAEAVGTVAGPVVAGVLLALAGGTAAFGTIAAVYLASALASVAIRTPFQPASSSGRSWVAEAVAGFEVLLGRDLRLFLGLAFAQCVMRGLLNVFLVVIALDRLGSESRAAGFFAAVGVGGVLGALLAFRTSGRDAGRRFALALVLWGAPVLLLGLLDRAWVPWVAMGVVGVGNALEDIYVFTLMDRLVPDAVAGRVYGAFWSLMTGAVGLGSLVGPPLVVWLGLGPAMVASGAVLTSLPVVSFAALRRLDRTFADPAVGLRVEALEGVALVSALPRLGLERLARRAVPAELGDGEVAVRQGDRPDRYAVVTAGALAVEQDGRQVRVIGPGDGFGEVGLLSGGHRTATVVSRGPSRLLWLDGRDFVAAVTGHHDVDADVHRAVERYLQEDQSRRARGTDLDQPGEPA
jgi:CRP-like cAMP-binding protein